MEKINIDTVSDENISWIEAQFSIGNNELIKLIADDVGNATVNSFETNSNMFLKESPIKIGQKLDRILMEDSVEFSSDEGPLVIRKGKYEIISQGLKEINELMFDSILVARERRHIQLLPKIVLRSKVDVLRIYKYQYR